MNNNEKQIKRGSVPYHNYKTFNDKWIKQVLCLRYGSLESNMMRGMTKIWIQNRGDIILDFTAKEVNEGLGNGCIFFMLEGSPPKAYAIYTPGHNKLTIMDAWHKQRGTYEQHLYVDKLEYGWS